MKHDDEAAAAAPVSPKELSDTQLEPLAVWAHSCNGAIVRIAKRMAEKSGNPVNRHMVGRWLNEDVQARIQPSHGYALLLAEVVAELQEEDRQRGGPPPRKNARAGKAKAK